MRANITPDGAAAVHTGDLAGFPANKNSGKATHADQHTASRHDLTDRAVNPRDFAYRLASVLVITDWFVAFFAIFASLSLREWQRIGLAQALASQPSISLSITLWSLGGSFVFIWLMVLYRTYEVSSLYQMGHFIKNMVKAVLMWAVIVWACVGFFRWESFSPRVGTAYCIVSMICFLGLWRTLSFAYLLQPRVKAAASARVIVIGWNAQAANLHRQMRFDLSQLSDIVGCVPMPGGFFKIDPPSEVPVLGDYSALATIVRECNADAIILADVSCASSEIHNLITFCQREYIGFRMVPQYFPALSKGLQVETVSGVPLLGVSRLPLDRALNRGIKRGADIIGALVGLAISSLIVPFFCLAVYLESPGPVIFKQRRTSRSGRDFYIYKIRSMRLNAEGASGAVWCKEKDPRRLKIGSFMRKTNIDELPQFWNVLKGDMSLVGPRPERPELIAKFKDEIPNYNARHEARAGLTGWAQIKGLRGDTDLIKRIEADLYYLENWSVTLDVYCIFSTFFKRKNAY
jgi:exopolysaccharide biosynthesis polyprenyl glycosylphosphotransferase